MKNKKNITIKEVNDFDSIADMVSLAGLAVQVSDYKNKKFRLLREAKQRMESVLLDMEAWNVLWQVDGRRSVENIASNLNLPIDRVVYHIEGLRLMGIICATDAVYLPDFILQKASKSESNQQRRKNDADDNDE